MSPDRAVTYGQKRAVIEQILSVWAKKEYSELRLGQLLFCVLGECSRDLFTIEDKELAREVKAFGSREVGHK